MHHAVAAALRGAIDLVLPPHDLDRETRAQSVGLSGGAWARIQFLEDPVCDGCGLPFEYGLGEGVRCAACEARPPAFARARAACLYDENSRDLILKLKHADRPELAALFAAWLARAAAPLVEEADLVVPVPLHPLRLLSRRYNQAAEIARPLARRAGLAYAPGLLRRKRATPSQAGKSGRGRRMNLRGAIEVVPGRAERIAGKRVLVIDDVLTTGATAEACARALLGAGAAAVDVATVARVRVAADLTI